MDVSPVSGKKLRQAQLPFVLVRKIDVARNTPGKIEKKSPDGGSSSDYSDDKENIFTGKRKTATGTKNVSGNKAELMDIEPMVVDLTGEDSCHAADFNDENSAGSKMPLSTLHNIEEAINNVVKRCSTEFAVESEGILTPKETGSAKKRRRRSKSMSPLPPNAKRAILCSEENNDPKIIIGGESVAKESYSSGNTDHVVPKIIVTSATPIGKQKPKNEKKPLEMFFEKVNKLVPQKAAEVKQPTMHEKHASKYPPLSSVLSKKRPRSKSPAALKDQTAAKVNEEKPLEIDSSSSTTPSKKLKQVPNEDGKIVAQELITPVKAPVMSAVDQGEKNDSEICKSPPVSTESLDSSQADTPSPPQKNTAAGGKVTPKSATKSLRNLEAQRKKEEKEQEKEEKRKQREEQRLAKEKEKMELKRKKDEEKAQKEEERRKKREEEEAAKIERQKKFEEKRREREKLELEKRMEKEKKEEERKKEKEKKEEEKRQKELERQKAEEEKKQAEDDKKRKSEKRAETFKSFFKSPAKSPTVKKNADSIGIFVAFQPKQDMLLAPLYRTKISSSQKKHLDDAMKEQTCNLSYLQEVKGLPMQRPTPTMPKLKRRLVSLDDDGLELVEDGETKPGVKILLAKYLSFHTNHRPPYYGTWRKESQVLSCKNPFKKDKRLFDYEFDSDDEWEEPADGEDIANSDGEDEGDTNEEDEDDGFFVPHGYLSDDEGNNEEGEEDGLKPDHKLKQKQLEFEASFKRKLSTLTPIVIGCIWKDSADSLDKIHREILDCYKPEILCKAPIEIYPAKANVENENDFPADSVKPELAKKKLKAVPEEAMPDLIRLLHGNALSLARIVNEFRVYWKSKNASDEPISHGPAPLDDPPPGAEMEQMDVETEPAPSTACKPDSAPPSGRTSPAEENLTKSIVSTPKSGDMEFEISKTQLLKKCKEIASYSKKDNINRSCWFVQESVLDNYDLAGGIAPIPCKWNYVTEVPKIQILIFPKTTTKPALVTESSTPQPLQSPRPSIAKFVAKLSPKVILEQSKLKHEKTKQALQMSDCSPAPVPSISKYTTEKISPIVIIEKSAHKIAEDMAKSLQAQELETAKSTQNAANVQSQDGIYVIPTPEAMQSLFRIDLKGNSVVASGSTDGNGPLRSK